MTAQIRTVSALALAAAGLAAPAAAEFKYENGSGGSVTLYGQFNPAIISVDDGQQTETNLVDNDLSRSRLGILVDQPLGANTFGFRFEAGLGFPNSTEYNQLGSDISGWTRQDIRHFDFWLSGDWGQVSLGQGSMASDGAAEANLSYAGTALYAYTADTNAAYLFRDPFGVLSGPSVGSMTSDFDGGRLTRLRYDTPRFSGLKLSAAWGRNELAQNDDRDYYDIAASYSRSLGNAEFKAGLAYAVRDDNGVKRSDVIGSAAVLLSSGLSFAASVGTRDDDTAGASDPDYYYLNVGYEGDWLAAGKTGFGVHYYDGADFNRDGSSSEVVGLGVVQRVDAWNVDAYLTYQTYSYEDDVAAYQDLSTVALGAIWKF
ncbi:Outer membrane protein (porin) [Cribrihabitans marinus]|uniref:Outer membrane protein (Porin) n=1 Tax=Cribrihabitans marinus TaxID=1227549 RepID=A0A1H6V966_9RHOB|nr:porin [Cribrihabitans marinus]GGH26214.1 hypothetical protein GCM10010973_13860 [Cribrihabitans marinus]SEJ00366.1 Outer membrane protein (porin) [Cribrihabitans marinus]